jgi:three-Cys-motif partner protein
MIKKPRDNTVGPWAKEKLEALEQYLNFYTTVLKNQNHWLLGTIFVDAFAGPGLSRVRSAEPLAEPIGLFGAEVQTDPAEAEFLRGSPRVALEIRNPFSSYIFVERNPERVEELNKLKSDFGPARIISVQEDDANSALKAWLASSIDWKRHRAVVFLDPFGMQVPWSTIEALAKTKAIEVIINFPLGMAIQRLLIKSGQIPPGWQLSLDTFFGSKDWRNLVYEAKSDLLGSQISKVDKSGIKLLEWYRGRLRNIFGHVSTARLIKNTRGNPLYYLIWAGPNRKGLEGAEYILSKGENVSHSKSKKQ